MTKEQLVTHVAEKTGLTRKDAEIAVTETIKAIEDALLREEPLDIT